MGSFSVNSATSCGDIRGFLLPDENKDAGGQRDKIEQENGWAEIQAEAQQTINDQIDCQ
jgi:hypothetical protein